MRIKPGANLDGISAAMLHACAVIDEIYIRIAGHEVTLTSGKDGKHSDRSLHYEGNADDFRKRDVSPNDYILILAEVKRKLGKDYDVIDEATHMHVEYDPKG